MARGLKFRILKVNGLYYLCSENKDADQLRGDREANLRLCFSHMQNVGFLIMRLIYGRVAILVMWQGCLEQTFVPLHKEVPHKIYINLPSGFKVEDVWNC